MTQVHIYTAALQPATCWTDVHGPEPFTIRWPGNRLLRSCCCNKPRPAKNCRVQSFYDALSVWCAPGKGCKHPKLVAAKKQREFENRSAGQRKRWERVWP